jgi:hypothetical protein
LETTANDEGWVRLYRKIQRSAVFQNEGLLKVWIWCMVKANHEDKWVPITTGKGTTEVLVKRGQFVFGRKSAAKALGMDESTVYKRMQKLTTMQNCNIQSNTHYSLVSVLNYEPYQGGESEQVTGKVTPKEHPSNTNKNYKNKRIYVEGSIELRLASFLLEEIQRNKPDFKKPNLQTWAREINLMIRRDGRVTDRIREIIVWAQSDSFWRKNILSTGSLRDKFDRLELAMQEKSTQGSDRTTQYQDLTGRGTHESS